MPVAHDGPVVVLCVLLLILALLGLVVGVASLVRRTPFGRTGIDPLTALVVGIVAAVVYLTFC